MILLIIGQSWKGRWQDQVSVEELANHMGITLEVEMLDSPVAVSPLLPRPTEARLGPFAHQQIQLVNGLFVRPRSSPCQGSLYWQYTNAQYSWN